jgi:hypothetical protein
LFYKNNKKIILNYSTVKITNKTANQLQVQKNVNRKRETVRDGAEFKKDITY